MAMRVQITLDAITFWKELRDMSNGLILLIKIQ